MAKTLLEITQKILSDVSGDEVNSYTDTEESESLARIIVGVYEAMISSRNWPHTRKLFKLTSPSDSERPTHLSVPSNCNELISISYNKDKSTDTRLYFKEIFWKEPDDFLRLSNSRNSESTNIKTVTDDTGIKFLIYNDRHPTYYTSFDDVNIIMDAYDSSVDTTLHPDNTQAYGYLIEAATLSDSWTPDLPDEAFAALENEAKSVFSYDKEDKQHAKAEQESTRQDRWLARKNWAVNGGLKYPNYGRKGRGAFRDINFKQRSREA